jgi:hypothetical protein
MKAKKAAWAMGLAFVLGQSAYGAVIAPTVVITMDSYDYPVPQDKIIPEPGTDRWLIDNYYMNIAGTGSVQITGVIDPDPSISYGISVTDFGAPSSFSFTFTSPIVPTGSPNFVTGSLVGGLTDNTGDGISMTPTQVDMDSDSLLEMQTSGVIGGGPVTNMGVDTGPVFSAPPGPPGALHNYLASVAGPLLGPSGTWDTLTTTLAFQGSGNGDIYSMTGFSSIEAVPEPGVMGLVTVAVGMLGRRRRR